MISSANSAIASIPAPPQPQSNAPSSDDSSSFSDVMQQQQQQHQAPQSQSNNAPAPQQNSTKSDSGSKQTTDADSTSDDSNPAPTSTAPTTPATPAPAKQPQAPVAAGSDLSAMIVQATVLASNLQALTAKNAAPTAGTTTTPAATNTPTKDTTSTDLSTLISQAASFLSGPKTTATAKSSGPAMTPATAGKTNKDAGTAAADSTTATPTDLSALIVQASLLGTGNTTTATTTGTNSPSAGAGKMVTGATAKEKKSASSDAGGSFLQSGTSTPSTLADALNLLSTLSGAAGNASGNQTLTGSAGAKNSAVGALTSSANALAGTANDEKGKDMNATLNTSATDLLSTAGANQSASTTPDLQIKLSSNTDFTDALKQVMHVASLTQTAESRTPMRVEMEIQTPPGAIVNIYVSKSGDNLRAQLSTNDPVALAWVQNQMSSLKSTGDLGVNVKWAPPQLETGTQITTSGSQDANLGWNQGGNQSQYQQPDERQQNNPQQTDDEGEFATVGGTNFMNSLTSAARAA